MLGSSTVTYIAEQLKRYSASFDYLINLLQVRLFAPSFFLHLFSRSLVDIPETFRGTIIYLRARRISWRKHTGRGISQIIRSTCKVISPRSGVANSTSGGRVIRGIRWVLETRSQPTNGEEKDAKRKGRDEDTAVPADIETPPFLPNEEMQSVLSTVPAREATHA